MRTNNLCDFNKKISEINNHLSHTVFVFKQFILDNEELTKKKPNELTIKEFSENIYAEQFNVKLKDIEEQSDKTFNYLLDTLFVFTNTQFEVYLKDVYLFVKHNSQLRLPEPPESKVYETILDRLSIDKEKDIDNLFVSTYDYFKYRRNAIMHRDKNRRLQGAVEDLIKGKNPDGIFRVNQLNGTELNLHWRRYNKNLEDNNLKGYSIKSFDFANKDISKFITLDLFDIFNFYRLYASKLDQLILSKIDRKHLLSYLKDCYVRNYGSVKEESLDKFKSRFVRTNKLELNLSLTDSEIVDLHNGI